jgi:hypothetical protein
VAAIVVGGAIVLLGVLLVIVVRRRRAPRGPLGHAGAEGSVDPSASTAAAGDGEDSGHREAW